MPPWDAASKGGFAHGLQLRRLLEKHGPLVGGHERSVIHRSRVFWFLEISLSSGNILS